MKICPLLIVYLIVRRFSEGIYYMIYILFTIVLVSPFFVIFHLFGKHRIHSFQAIVFNYITCIIIGLLSSGK